MIDDPREGALQSPLAGLVSFAADLRAAGLRTSVDRDQRFVDAVSRFSLTSRADIYWAGRSTLCSNPDDTRIYDSRFASWFGGEESLLILDQNTIATAAQAELAGMPQDDELDGPGPALAASEREVLRRRDIAELPAEELAQLRQLFANLRVIQPMRRGHRFDPHSRGDIDRARSVRDLVRRAGEPSALRRRRRRPRPRRVVLLIDVSGSMEPYADSLLRLAHRMVDAAPLTEVFTIGTRLTRVTTSLRARDPLVALERVGSAVPDWSGGTRLAESVAVFNRQWGRRGMARGAVVVVASDGLERGDASLLGDEIGSLGRVARAIVWVSPHRGKQGYQPVQGGIAAVLPHITDLVAGHSLAAFQEVLDIVGRA